MTDTQIDTIEEENTSDLATERVDSEDGGSVDLDAQMGGEVEGEDGDQPPQGTESRVSNRIPSQHSKARLSRMTHSAGSLRGDEGLSTDEEDDRPILITEIKDNEDGVITRNNVQPGQITQVRLGRSRNKEKAPSRKTQQKTGDDEWDTDLEEDFKSGKKSHKGESLAGVDPELASLQAAYLRQCEKLGVVPVSYFLRHLEEPEITMRYHGLGPQGTQAIAKVLKENVSVERLNLAGNWMEDAGAMYMARMLHENDYITELSLSENKMGTQAVVHIAKMLTVNSGLRKLDLSNNAISDKDAELLADALEQNKFLRELNLSNNNLGQDAGEILGPAIGANDILDMIDLSWNQIRRKGAVSVARGLKENIRLKTVNLAWNGFGPEGGVAIGDAIGVNESLQYLDISGNRMDAQSALTIAKGLRKNEDLVTLKLGNNPIKTKGAIDIATALHDNENSQISCLDFTDIPVEYDLLRLCDDIKKKRELQVIHGPILRSGNTLEDIGKPGVDPFRRDPLLVLREHIVTHDLRLQEVLEKYDESHSYSLSPEDFTAALEEIAAPFSKEQIDELVFKLDTNGDGRVFYGDIFREMENAAIQAQEKGYMGFLPRTPAMQSRNQSFLKDNSLDSPSNLPFVTSQVVSSTEVADQSSPQQTGGESQNPEMTSEEVSSESPAAVQQEEETVAQIGISPTEMTE